MSSSYHMEKKTFMEASCNHNIHTGEKDFLQLLLLKVWESFLFRQSKKTCSILGLYDSSLDFRMGEDQMNTDRKN